jgi:hypothetical protein
MWAPLALKPNLIGKVLKTKKKEKIFREKKKKCSENSENEKQEKICSKI